MRKDGLRLRIALLGINVVACQTVLAAELDVCRYPFEQKCKKYEGLKDGEDEFSRAATLELQAALNEAKSSLGVSDLGEVFRKILTSRGFSTSPIQEADRERFEFHMLETLYDLWDSRYPGYQWKTEIAPPTLKKCQDFFDGKPTPEGLLGKVLAESEKLDQHRSTIELYDELVRACGYKVENCAGQDMKTLEYEVLEAHVKAKHPNRDQIKANALRERISGMLKAKAPAGTDSLTSACQRYGDTWKVLFERECDAFRKYLSRSKPVVRSLERHFFADATQDRIESMITFSKESGLALFDREIGPKMPESARTQARKKLVNTNYYRYDVVADNDFETVTDFPAPVLKEEVRRDDLFNPFADTSLKFFRTFNAFYSLPVSTPVGSMREGIYFLPSPLLLGSKDPDAVQFVVSHELGHPIDPWRLSSIGIDTKGAYDKLLECLTQNTNMQPAQRGEAVADWISARINGARLSAIQSPKDRTRSIDRFMAYFCQGKGDVNQSFLEGFPHPLPQVRRMYIYGADPGIRAALGCAPVPHCGMDGEIQPLAVTPAATSDSNAAEDAR